MGARKKDSLTMEVADLSEGKADSVVPNGEIWEIEHFFGNAAYLDDTVVCLVWDADGPSAIPPRVPVILACTHGDASVDMDQQVTGDGIKVLRISLANDTNTARVMGAGWKGRVIS